MGGLLPHHMGVDNKFQCPLSTSSITMHLVYSQIASLGKSGKMALVGYLNQGWNSANPFELFTGKKSPPRYQPKRSWPSTPNVSWVVETENQPSQHEQSSYNFISLELEVTFWIACITHVKILNFFKNDFYIHVNIQWTWVCWVWRECTGENAQRTAELDGES